jgi:hypothetical protein
MLRIWTQDSMTRIFPTTRVPEFPEKEAFIRSAKNEVACFQIGVTAPSRDLNNLKVETVDLVSESGGIIAKDDVEVLYPGYVPVHWHSAGNDPDDLEGTAPGFYPDPLFPSLWRGVDRVAFPNVISLWIRINVNESISAGNYKGNIKISCSAGEDRIKVELQVLSFALPKRSHFLMTNWFLTGPIMKFHKLEPLTERFWQVIDRYAKNLADHRQNVVLTPLFCMKNMPNLIDGRIQGQLVDILETESDKYSFDFHNLDRWIEMFFGHNFEVIEGSHLAGGSIHPVGVMIRKQGKDTAEYKHFESTMDNNYRNFIQQYLLALRKHLSDKGWLGRFYLHLSDEPHGDQFEPYTSLAKFVKNLVPEIPLMDAMGSGEYAPFVDHPVPLESVYEDFVKSSGIPQEQIWFYYCCGPGGPYPNRFIDYPLIRVRIFTWLAFKYGVPGFLHWGLNHWDWHPPFYIEHTYNPYDNTTGGSLQAGDSYVIYPPLMPSKSDDPVDSIRWEIIRKAMEDYEYLYMLRKIADDGDEQAKHLFDRINESITPDFKEYTRNHHYLEDVKTQIGQIIMKHQT